MLPVRKVTVQTHNCYKPTRHPRPHLAPHPPPSGQLQPCGRFGGHKEGSRSSPSTSTSRAGGPLEPLSTLGLGVPTLSVLLSPACSGVDSTQPPSPYVPVCIRGAERHPGNPPDRQQWGWGAPQAEAGPLGAERPLAPDPLVFPQPVDSPRPVPYNHQRRPAPQAHPELDPGEGASPTGHPLPQTPADAQQDARGWDPELGAGGGGRLGGGSGIRSQT